MRRYGLHEQRVPAVAHGLDVGKSRGMVHLGDGLMGAGRDSGRNVELIGVHW